MEKEEPLSREELLHQIQQIAFANAGDFAEVVEDENGAHVRFIPTQELSADKRTALALIKESKGGVEVRCKDSLRALELLCRVMGLLKTEKKEEQGRLAELMQGLLDSPEQEEEGENGFGEEDLQ